MAAKGTSKGQSQKGQSQARSQSKGSQGSQGKSSPASKSQRPNPGGGANGGKSQANRGGQANQANKSRSGPSSGNKGGSSSTGQKKGPPQRKRQGGSQSGGGGGNEGGGQGGAGSAVVDKMKQHPYVTAVGAGLAVLASAGISRLISSAAAQDQGNEPEGAESSGDEDAGDEGEGMDAEASDAEASDEESEDDDEADQDESEGDEGAQGEADDASGQGLGGRLMSALSTVGSKVRGGGSSLGSAAHRGFDSGKDAAARAWHEHPLVMAGVALAAGVTLGMLLPSTRQEDRLMGKVSDKMAGRVKTAGRDLLDQGKNLVTRAAREAASATAKEAEREGLTPDRIGRKVKRVATHVREAVTQAVQDAE